MPPVDSALSTDSPGTQAGTDGAEPSTSALSTGSFRPRVLDESAHKLAREIAKDKKKSTEALIAIGAIDPHDVAVASALDELRRACANIIKADPKTWPYHHHAPLIPIAINAAKQAPAGNIGISAKLHRPKASAVAGPQVVTAEMEEAGRKYARENDPSTFAGIFEAMRAVAPQTSPPNIGPAVKVLKQYAEQIKSTHIGDDGTWGEEASAKKWYDEVIRAIAMLEQPGAVARLTALNTMARKLLGVVGSQPKATQLLVTKRLLVDAANEINTLAAWVENHDSETQNTRRAEKALRALLDAMEYAPPNSGCSGYVFIPKAIIEQAREALDVPPESAA